MILVTVGKHVWRMLNLELDRLLDIVTRRCRDFLATQMVPTLYNIMRHCDAACDYMMHLLNTAID